MLQLMTTLDEEPEAEEKAEADAAEEAEGGDGADKEQEDEAKDEGELRKEEEEKEKEDGAEKKEEEKKGEEKEKEKEKAEEETEKAKGHAEEKSAINGVEEGSKDKKADEPDEEVAEPGKVGKRVVFNRSFPSTYNQIKAKVKFNANWQGLQAGLHGRVTVSAMQWKFDALTVRLDGDINGKPYGTIDLTCRRAWFVEGEIQEGETDTDLTSFAASTPKCRYNVNSAWFKVSKRYSRSLFSVRSHGGLWLIPQARRGIFLGPLELSLWLDVSGDVGADFATSQVDTTQCPRGTNSFVVSVTPAATVTVTVSALHTIVTLLLAPLMRQGIGRAGVEMEYNVMDVSVPVVLEKAREKFCTQRTMQLEEARSYFRGFGDVFI